MGFFSGVLFLGLFAWKGHAAELPERCSFVDLRSKVSLHMRNQGDISWCYAHTAADLLQFNSGLTEQVSAADIAVQYNKKIWPKIYRWVNGTLVPETGFLKPALRQAIESGYCPEEAFPSETWLRVGGQGQSAPKVEKKTLNLAISEILDLQRLVLSGIFKSSGELPFHYEFRGVDRSDFFEILRSRSRQEVLEGLRLKACDGRRKPYPFEIESISMRFRGPGMFQRIRDELEQGRAISLDYFYSVLEDSSRIRKKLSDLHTSIVLGQRFDPSSGECQYLIKNSYGESCTNFDPKWECQRGYLWVGESALREGSVSYVSVKSQEK